MIVNSRIDLVDLSRLYFSQDSSCADLVARVKEITSGKLAYGALDAVGGDLTKVCFSLRTSDFL